MKLRTERRITQAVFGVFLAAPFRAYTAPDLARLLDASREGTRSVLWLLLDCGWAYDQWEALPPGAPKGTPRRRYYAATQVGVEGMREALAAGLYLVPLRPVPPGLTRGSATGGEEAEAAVG